MDFLSKILHPFRSDPMFELGQLLFISNDVSAHERGRYLVIEDRRWANEKSWSPQGGWFYDGTVFQIDGDELVKYAVYGINFPEVTLTTVKTVW